MEKIKVIDLLNKIANGEEVPKKITIDKSSCEFEWNGNMYLHRYADYDFVKPDYIHNLDKEIHIIEDTPKEDKKIEKLDIYFNGCENKISIEDATDNDTQIEFVAYRLNDMIDEFYKLKEKVEKVNGEDNE